MSRLTKAILVICIFAAGLAAALSVTYVYGKNYCRTHFGLNTYVNGKDVSRMEMQPVLEEIKAAYPTTFVIKEKDGKEESFDFSSTITNEDIDHFVQEQKDNADQWYHTLFNETVFQSSDIIEIDEEAFKELAKEKLEEVKRTPSTDAYLNIEEMAVVPETVGNEINVEKACEKATAAAVDNVYEVTLNDEYILPNVYRDDTSLTSVIDEYNRRIDRKIRINVADGIKETIGPKKLTKWISYDGKEFRFDEDAVFVYTENLEDKYNTAWSDRAFETSAGSTIYVGRGEYDSYTGWLMNEDGTYQSILSAVESEDGKNAEVTWDYEGYTLDENGNDIGGTYIEVSVDDQHMWFYKDYELILDTDVVTGTETDPTRSTPRGLFYLLEMHSPYVMHGDYGEQPCEYFIKVTWDGVAIHDADWQSSFGGSTYLYGGSHGCINTPHEVVAVLWDYLYEMEDWQIPVIIY